MARRLAPQRLQRSGLVGDDALVFAEQFGAGLTNLAHQMNLTDEEFPGLLEDVAGPGAVGIRRSHGSDERGGMRRLGRSGKRSSTRGRPHVERVFGLTETSTAGTCSTFSSKSGQSAETFAAQLERMAESDPQLRALIDHLDPPPSTPPRRRGRRQRCSESDWQAHRTGEYQSAGVEARILPRSGTRCSPLPGRQQTVSSTLGAAEQRVGERDLGYRGRDQRRSEQRRRAYVRHARRSVRGAQVACGATSRSARRLDHGGDRPPQGGDSAATGWSAEQIDTMIATAADVPPPVQPVPPETTASPMTPRIPRDRSPTTARPPRTHRRSWLTTARRHGRGCRCDHAGFADMASQTLSALQSVIGVADDGKSVQALSFRSTRSRSFFRRSWCQRSRSRSTARTDRFLDLHPVGELVGAHDARWQLRHHGHNALRDGRSRPIPAAVTQTTPLGTGPCQAPGRAVPHHGARRRGSALRRAESRPPAHDARQGAGRACAGG